ncbi:protein FAM229B-like [Neophocaena asiaeorientalis asiaeorientalis]|uniref:Protein FAM229B n=1 Tax=Neophocaena asiaeorientalis asiaeorientalis TaxID=1706337 RepID=A0A341B2J7_NEOAA|nr:protein FAM229B-like [Neophocaena asiaeorientalis asiaeorientalis]
MPFQFGTQPRRFPVEGGDSPVGLEPGLSSSAACNEKETSPTRQLGRCPGSHGPTITDVPITVYATMRKPPSKAARKCSLKSIIKSSVEV